MISEEAKQNIRRRNMARRLHKAQPLFAYEAMQQLFPSYSYIAFLADISRTKPKKQRKGKSGMIQFGRFEEMKRLISLWKLDKDPDILRKAVQLRQQMTQPYRLKTRFGKEEWIMFFPPTYTYKTMQQLAILANKCATKQEFDTISQDLIDRENFGKNHKYGLLPDNIFTDLKREP